MPADIAIRASHADRERVAGQLGDHLAAGRLDLAEYDDRVVAAYAAVTVDDLRTLLQDLPTQFAAVRPPHPAVSGAVPKIWRSWAITTAICLTIWAATSIAAGDIDGFWPFWVFGPWGAVLLIRTLRPLRASRCA